MQTTRPAQTCAELFLLGLQHRKPYPLSVGNDGFAPSPNGLLQGRPYSQTALLRCL